jgi:hypothetical protein
MLNRNFLHLPSPQVFARLARRAPLINAYVPRARRLRCNRFFTLLIVVIVLTMVEHELLTVINVHGKSQSDRYSNG